MSLREDSTRSARQGEAKWDGTYQQRCKAYGCPCGASVITDYGEFNPPGGPARRLPKAGLCGFHNGVAPAHWARATTVLRHHDDLLGALHALDSMSAIEQYRTPPRMVGDDVETKPKEGENTLAWKARMRALIRGRIDRALQ